MKRNRLAAAAVLLASISAIASAQVKSSANMSNPVSFGVSAGIALPMGDFGTNTNMGFGGSGHVWYKLAPEFSLRGDVSYTTFGGKGAFSAISVSGFGFGVNGVFDIATDGGVKPYVTAGLGMYSNSASGCPGGCPAGETKFGFNGGGGINFEVGGQMIFVEARYVSVQSTGTSTNFIPITVGIRF